MLPVFRSSEARSAVRKTNIVRARKDAAEARITSHASAVVRAAMELVARSERLSPGCYQIAPVLMLRLRTACEEMERQSKFAGRLYITRSEE